jgi:hypothetical protein
VGGRGPRRGFFLRESSCLCEGLSRSLAAIPGTTSAGKRPVTDAAIAAELGKLRTLYEDLAWQMADGRATEYQAILQMNTVPFFEFLEVYRRNKKTA